MATFLKLALPGQPTQFRVLNVVEFHAEPLRWLGAPPRRAFAGNLLSTQHSPRREYGCTVQFSELALLEGFIAFCSTAIDFQTGRYTGLRDLVMTSDASPAGALYNGGPLTVRVEFGQARPMQDELVTATTYKQQWLQDLIIREA